MSVLDIMISVTDVFDAYDYYDSAHRYVREPILHVDS